MNASRNNGVTPPPFKLQLHHCVWAAVGLLAILLFFKSEISAGIDWFDEHSAVIGHCFVAATIILGGSYLSSQTARSEGTAWQMSELCLLAGIAYLVFFLGLPWLMEEVSGKVGSAFKG